MVTETSLSSSSRPEETRRISQFCSAPFLDGYDADLLLKPNVAFIIKNAPTDRSTEDLIDLAQSKIKKLNFRGIKINSRWAAIAVLAGLQ